MAEKRIALGIVGASTRYGWGMRAHLPAFLALPEYELVAVCTAHQETAEESARHYEAPKAYSDYRDLVSDPEIEVVDVCIRAPSHYEVAMAALEAGKHVFCEWPLGANSTQADEMAALANAKGVRTMVGLQSRYAPSFQHLRMLVDQGYLGRMLSANMTMFLPGIMRPRPERSIWGADKNAGAHALNIATGHALDIFLWCLGEMENVAAVVTTQVPEWAIANTDRTVNVTSPDNVLLVGHLVNGAVASVHVASVPWHGTAFRMEAYGTEGTLVATSDQMVEMVDPVLRGAKESDDALHLLSPPNSLRWIPPEVPDGVAVNMAQMFRRFATVIREGGEAHPDFVEAARRHHTLDALNLASDTGKWVKV
ncbi:Gfo/Idh/MocA family oxidoreductase [SAR202 cluster bacterium AC-647-N09_OGT_505m]|nr:Gfo/Idh/MocA family oxidoreductase [SAR202 cluster bacterium AC-647-N09_OGT_505m]